MLSLVRLHMLLILLTFASGAARAERDGTQISRSPTAQEGSVGAAEWLPFREKPHDPRKPHSEAPLTRQQEEEARALVAQLKPMAEAGDIEAMAALGVLHDLGIGTEENDEEALRLFRRCAATGDANCQRSIGIMYQNGQGVPVDKLKAIEWFRTSVQSGNGEAAVDIGDFHRFGIGVPANPKEALVWYRKAAAMQSARGLAALATIYDEGSLGLRADKAEARRLYTRAVEIDDRWGLVELGDMWLLGKGGKRDPVRAMELFSRAAERGDPTAMFRLGSAFDRGLGVARDPDAAVFWLRQAVEAGSGEAKGLLTELQGRRVSR